eukprot:6208869-Pleurochrysis_carterae.AAC.10
MEGEGGRGREGEGEGGRGREREGERGGRGERERGRGRGKGGREGEREGERGREGRELCIDYPHRRHCPVQAARTFDNARALAKGRFPVRSDAALLAAVCAPTTPPAGHGPRALSGRTVARGASRLDEAEEQVGGECALVRLVEHDGGVAPERRVVHRLAQQHPVGQVLEYRLGPARVVEADGVANLLAQRDAKLLRDAFRHRHGRHATRLRARDQLPIGARQRVEQKRRDLLVPTREQRYSRGLGETAWRRTSADEVS